MKKIILVAIVLLIAGFAYSNDYGLMGINGDDWITMNTDQKELFVGGILLGFDVVRTAVDENKIDSDTVIDEDGWTADDYFICFAENFYLGKNVTEIVDMLNRYYKPRENRNNTVWSVIMVNCGKAWW